MPCSDMLHFATKSCDRFRKVLLEQQTSLRLMQADPTHGDAAVDPANRNALEPSSTGFRKMAGKSTDISPWESVGRPYTHNYRPAQLAVKGGKKLKKAPMPKQQRMDIPPALTALLQTVKQVHIPAALIFPCS
jgi:hypothetical protein